MSPQSDDGPACPEGRQHDSHCRQGRGRLHGRFELVASLARPGSDVTGISSLGREIVRWQLERLQLALPRVTRVAVLHGVTDFTGTWKALREAAQSSAMTLHRFEVREPTAFDGTLAAMTRTQVRERSSCSEGAEPSRSFQRQIADLAVQRRLPSMCQSHAADEGRGVS